MVRPRSAARVSDSVPWGFAPSEGRSLMEKSPLTPTGSDAPPAGPGSSECEL